MTADVQRAVASAQAAHEAMPAELKAAIEKSGLELRESLARNDREILLRLADVRLPPPVFRAIVAGRLDLNHNRAIRAVTRWKPTTAPVLILQGSKGGGKTVAAAWWLAHAGGLLRHTSELVRAWGSTTHGAAVARAEMCDCRALVLDDVGAEASREHEIVQVALRELVERRQDRAGTLITTNLLSDEWSRTYPDARLASRLATALRIRCAERDFRTGER